MSARACPDCGVALETDEQFCGSCGCYLEWTAADAAPDPVPGPVSGHPDVAPAQPPPSSRSGPRPSGPPPSGPPPSGPPPSGSPSPPPAPPSPTRSARPPSQAPAQALVAPQHPGPQQPQARQPGHAATPTPRRTAAPPEPLNPGDLVCGSCGTGNKPTRKFCRRCGQDLVDAVVAKVPWWRRLFRGRKPKVKEAGARPTATHGRHGFPTRLVTIIVVIAGLGIGGYLLRSSVLGGVAIVVDRVKGVERVVPAEVEASTAQGGHGADLVRDGTQNKYWAPADPGEGRGQYVEARFADPVRLVYVLITPGVSSSDEEAFLRQGRPAELRVLITHDDGTTDTQSVDLEDKRGAVRVAIRESDVTSARFEIRKAYTGTARGSRTAIGEIEFWVRK